jgi:DNA-binding response OmpR family regulator
MTKSTAGTLAGRTVLVVDDEPHLTQILAFNLRRAGAEVTTARNGAEALVAVRRQLESGRPHDLLITDYQMPLMTGSELCRALRDDPATAGMPTLMLTARGHNLPPADMGSNHICRMMGKPFSTAELLAHVRDLMPAAA